MSAESGSICHEILDVGQENINNSVKDTMASKGTRIWIFGTVGGLQEDKDGAIMAGGENWTVLVTSMSKCCIFHLYLTILAPID